jgi:crossover junction endodeoxyribonuclease RuvC
MTRILGIDPGSRVTGYGIIEVEGNRSLPIACGELRIEGETMAERLRRIFESLSQIVSVHAPEEVAVEQVFLYRNVDSALKLGQARGAAICAVVVHGLPVAEYTPRQIKQAVVGKGGAAKAQVQHMVRVLLGLPTQPSPDTADALAVALCHGHIAQVLKGIPGARGARRGRFR